MLKKIKKWGNSLALRIPKREAEELDLHENKEVEIEKKGENLMIKPKRSKLQNLLKNVDEENMHSAKFSTGKPQGKEVW